MQAKSLAEEALPLARSAGAQSCMRLINRGLGEFTKMTSPFSYYAFRFFLPLQEKIHRARMDWEQAAQCLMREAAGTEAGDKMACAFDTMLPYDPKPNIHPMDRRLSASVDETILAAFLVLQKTTENDVEYEKEDLENLVEHTEDEDEDEGDFFCGRLSNRPALAAASRASSSSCKLGLSLLEISRTSGRTAALASFL